VADKEGEELDFGELNLPDDDLTKDDSPEEDLAEMGEAGVPEPPREFEAAPLGDEEAEVAPLGEDAAEAAPLGDEDAEAAPFGDMEGLPVLETDEAADDREESGGDEGEEEEEKPSLLAKLREASPFTVMLGLSLVAILIAILCLLAQLKEYDYQTKPKAGGAARPTATAPSNQRAWLDATNRQPPSSRDYS